MKKQKRIGNKRRGRKDVRRRLTKGGEVEENLNEGEYEGNVNKREDDVKEQKRVGNKKRKKTSLTFS